MQTITITLPPETRDFVFSHVIFYGEKIQLRVEGDEARHGENETLVLTLYDANHRLIAQSPELAKIGVATWEGVIDLATNALALVFALRGSGAALNLFAELHAPDSQDMVGNGLVNIANNSKAISAFVDGGGVGGGGDGGGGEVIPDYGINDIDAGRVMEIVLGDNEELAIRNPENWPDGASHILVITTGETTQLDLLFSIAGYHWIAPQSVNVAFAYKAAGRLYIQFLHREDILA